MKKWDCITIGSGTIRQDMGMYISSDSIGLEANNPTLCGYVQDVTLNEQK